MRSTIRDQLSGREIVAGPEEQNATQPLVFYLTQRLGWDPRQIMTRPQWRVPKSPSASRTGGYPVDIAIFDSASHVGDPEHVRILVECKAPDEESGIGQLKTYLGLEPEARMGIWFNGRSHAIVYRLASGFSVNRYAPIPKPSAPLSPSGARPPLVFADLIPPPNLGELFRRLRDGIAAQDSQVNRDEFILNDLASLLVCKIVDEQAAELDPERPMAFQSAGSSSATGTAIRCFFGDVKRVLPSVFTDEGDRLHIDDSSLEAVVKALQPYRLLGHDRHAVGKAFEILRGRALKGEEGAYFTPPALVDCVVAVLDPSPNESVADPACGTGGFLAAALDHVFSAIDNKPALPADRRSAAKQTWAAQNLYAADKDAVSTKLCKAYLTLLGDGRAHVYRANTIDRSEWKNRADDISRVLAAGAFDLIMTNPPFGQNLKVSSDVGRAEGLLTSCRWTRQGDSWMPGRVPVEQQLGISFFERNLELLKPGGRMAIVLPETFLFSKSFRWFVDWVCREVTVTHVIDVPMVAFEEFCRAKTCLLFVTKQPPPSGHHILMSYPRSIGQDKRGNPLPKLSAGGVRSGGLDNEMAEAVEVIKAATSLSGKPTARAAVLDTRLCFRVPQLTAKARGVLVPRFWWRKDTDASLREYEAKRPCSMQTLGELIDRGILRAFEGHGSPPGNARRTGNTPYVKVTDLKNWRINENPTNFIHESVASALRRGGPELRFGDLITPSRASANIGQFCLVMPWQTNVVLTKEVLLLRVEANDEEIDPFLLLALMSLKVVQEQYQTLVLMQTNREHLGDHWREIRIPLPVDADGRRQLALPVRRYFEGVIQARKSYEEMLEVVGPEEFGTRP